MATQRPPPHEEYLGPPTEKNCYLGLPHEELLIAAGWAWLAKMNWVELGSSMLSLAVMGWAWLGYARVG